MAFVNAITTPEDIERYGLDLFDKRFHVHAVDASQWTVDRSRGLYLRIATLGGGEGQRQSRWTFLWRKDVLFLVFEAMESAGATGPTPYLLRQLDLPFHLRRYRDEIAEAIREALAVYQQGGRYAEVASFALALDEPPASPSGFGGLPLMGC